MLKTMLLAATVTGLLAGVTVSVQSTPAEAGSKCFKAAKEKYPGDRTVRREFRKWCKAEWKAYKKAKKQA
jgi:hypothetical protein